MPSITSATPTSHVYTDSACASARLPRSHTVSSGHRDTPNTGTVPANKKLLDMVALLEAAARHPEKQVDGGPAYYAIPPSPEEASAGWPA